eukprot:COSAG02_NODE_14871_length_1227_cov_5.310284_1_plen_61_part_00
MYACMVILANEHDGRPAMCMLMEEPVSVVFLHCCCNYQLNIADTSSRVYVLSLRATHRAV